MAHEILHADELSARAGVFVHATRVEASGHFIYVSGLTSRNRDGSVFGGGDVRAQTAHILDNLKIILARGNATLDDVVRVVVYITDMADFAAMKSEAREARPAPARVRPPRLDGALRGAARLAQQSDARASRR